MASSTDRYALVQNSITTALEELPSSVVVPAAGLASAIGGVEAYRQVAFEDLPAHVIQQLRTDGTRGEVRDLDGARAEYEQNVPAEAKGSIEGVDAITNDPDIHWMHQEPHAAGGSTDADNGLYGPGDLNQAIGNRPMTAAEVAEAEAYTLEVAEQATPGVTGDLSEVAGDTLETGVLGGVMGCGLAAAHRYAQAQGFRDAGRHDLAAAAENEMIADAAKGAVNGVVRGTTVAVTQAVLGANPLTAGIGLVAPDVVMLLSKKDQLSKKEYQQKSIEVVGKGAMATVLVCAGPVGWLGLAGYSIFSAYGKANQQGASGRSLA
ncbi:hypothetical protein [Synechococcus sp. EJ6-Ellesmere]|uniref:hypothetical protein n=1 Tax=Synechococcus sp. EJ6-Ellesmere TaxID=2823734 RepID=UPI0020CEEFD0|nr:hypothetical protein [Synechococcus sp. EJ6-Ellesmere]MCP9826454.1 hypothetical protein [Synechococcus sp. EJ6-Ellesmere]